MPGFYGANDPDPDAPESEPHTAGARRGPSNDIDRRLAAAERKIFDEIEPRLLDVEIRCAVEGFFTDRDDGNHDHQGAPEVLSEQKLRMPTHAKPAKFGKPSTFEDELELLKREIKNELREELLAALKEDVRAGTHGSFRISKQGSQADESRGLLAECNRESADHSDAVLTSAGQPVGDADMPEIMMLAENPTKGHGGIGKTTSKDVEFDDSNLELADHGCNRPIRLALLPHDLGTSIWDTSIFLFHEELGCAGSVQLAMQLLFNVFAQCVFCIISLLSFTEPNINNVTVASAATFRSDNAHASRHVNPLTGETLARRVCNKEEDLTISASQVSLLQSIDQYFGVGESSWHQTFNGELMCCLAIACWGMSLSKEANAIINAFRSMQTLVHRGNTVIAKHPDGTMVIDKIGSLRFAFICSTFGIRIAIAAILLYVGALFLVIEIDVGSLLLNAVALEFILNIDELIFESLTPDHVRVLMANLQQLSRRVKNNCDGFGLRAFASSIFVGLYVVVFEYAALRPMLNDMSSVKSELCDGSIDFVFGVDALGMVYLSGDFANKPSERQRAEQRRVIRTAIHLPVGTLLFPRTSLSGTPSNYSLTLDGMVSKAFVELVDLFNPLLQRQNTGQVFESY